MLQFWIGVADVWLGLVNLPGAADGNVWSIAAMAFCFALAIFNFVMSWIDG